MLAVAAVGIVPGAQHYGSWDGTDAVASGCAAPQELRPPDRIPGLLGTAAIVTLRYSYGCRTVWAELAGAGPGAEAWVARASDGRRESCTAGADGRCTTAQLDDSDTFSCAAARSGVDTVQTACY